MPYTSMPAWPSLSEQEQSDLAYFITTFSPDFTKPERFFAPTARVRAHNALACEKLQTDFSQPPSEYQGNPKPETFKPFPPNPES